MLPSTAKVSKKVSQKVSQKASHSRRWRNRASAPFRRQAHGRRLEGVCGVCFLFVCQGDVFDLNLKPKP
jgi:hypothetical protein